MTAAPEATTTDSAAKISAKSAASVAAAAVMGLIERPHRPSGRSWCCGYCTSSTPHGLVIGQCSRDEQCGRDERRARPALLRLGRSGT
jgi:hypothetical protein